MPPTRSDLHQNVPLQDLTVMTVQDESDFVLNATDGFVDVDHRSDSYYVYPSGSWNKNYMRARGTSDESAGATYELSTDTYSCGRDAVHIDFDWDDAADADEQVDPNEDAARFLANQIQLQGEKLYADTVFQTATWTTDWTGVASGPAANQFVQFDQSASDPQATMLAAAEDIKLLTGRRPNKMVVGHTVHTTLLTNAAVRDALKYTQKLTVEEVRGILAAYFGVEMYQVAGGIHNTAGEGVTATMATVLDKEDLWMGYVDPKASKRSISAYKVFAWRGKDRVQRTRGVLTRTFDIEQRTTTRHEAEWAIDVKVIAPDCGAFLKSAVA